MSTQRTRPATPLRVWKGPWLLAVSALQDSLSSLGAGLLALTVFGVVLKPVSGF